MESQATSVAAANSQSGTPSTVRLVIRVKLPSEGAPPAPAPRPSNRGALLLISAAAAVLLSWIGFSMFGTESTPAPIPAQNESTSVVRDEPLSQPATETTIARSVEVEPQVPKQAAASPAAVNEVIPNVARSAQESIRGTIIVSIRVTVDKAGNVLVASADDPGPSRYFERLATEAAKKWTFVQTATDRQRIALVRFYFTRDGTTARAGSPP